MPGRSVGCSSVDFRRFARRVRGCREPRDVCSTGLIRRSMRRSRLRMASGRMCGARVRSGCLCRDGCVLVPWMWLVETSGEVLAVGLCPIGLRSVGAVGTVGVGSVCAVHGHAASEPTGAASMHGGPGL